MKARHALRLAEGGDVRALRFAELFRGDDERVPLAGLDWGTRVLWDALAGV